jgi:hypothetical protein
MIKAIAAKRGVEHELEIFQQVWPAIKAALKAGGGADVVLKKSETLAAMKLIQATNSEKEEVRLKAATEILNRTQGKPVERSINVYGDLSRMDEKDLDSQIANLLHRQGATRLLKKALDIPTPKRSQKRKPRKSDPLVIEARYTERTEGAQSPAEAGIASAPEDQGTSR